MFAILVGISLKSAALLAVAWLGSFLLRSRSAAARHLVWTAASAAILALPLLSVSLPSWRIAEPGALAPANVGLVFRVLAIAGAETAGGPAAASTGIAQAAGAARQTDWRLWVLALWSLGAAIFFAQTSVAYLRMLRLRARARAFADSGEFQELAESLGVGGQVALLESAPSSMPMTFGVRRPAIFLPADAIHWSEERRRMVLLHELAHVRRADAATHLMARAALGINWWNPLAWSAWREFLKERERAADDLVLRAGARASDYASHLLEVARSMQPAFGTAGAAVAMARRAQLEGRLLAILDSRIQRHAVGRTTPLVAALAAVVLVAPFAAVRAQEQPAQTLPPEVDATIRAAIDQKNHEILEHAASAYEALQKYDLAQTLLENALAIREQVSGSQSAAYAAGLVKLGDLELKRNQRGEAQAFYTKAISLGDRPEVAGALVYMGMMAMNRERDTARDYFQRAIAVNPTGTEAGSAYTWLAEMQAKEPGGAGEAELLYQKALAAEDPETPEAASTMHLYARFLQGQDRGPEAEQMEKQAKAVTQTTATQFAKGLGGMVVFRSGAAPNQPTPQPTPQLDLPTPGPGVSRVGNGVSAPVLLSKVEPQYAEEARAAKYQGTVVVYVEVGTDGYAHNMKVVRGLGLGLDEKAIEAVSLWKFKPGAKEGQPVTVAATIEVNFRLL